MRNKIFTGLSMVFILSCGSGETLPELTPKEQDMANKKQDNINELNFGLGMADYGSFVAHVLHHWNYVEKDKNKEGATKKFETIINYAPESPYADSAKIYLDSIKYYNDLYNAEASSSLNEKLN